MQENMEKKTIYEFVEVLSSAQPVPGGGGASALCAALSASLCSMVANLTTGKKKYAEYQQDIEKIIVKMESESKVLLSYIEKDAYAFEPLSKAYHIPKDQEGREQILEAALKEAARVPMELLREIASTIDVIAELENKGSRLALSDVGVAASLARAAMEGAIMNVYINTQLMKNRELAKLWNDEASQIVKQGRNKCDEMYARIETELCKL